jgi:two-component system chemotaxis response regulator CheB
MDSNQKQINVLIIDDSASVRQVLTKILESDAGLNVIGTAPNATIALKKIRELNPDVLTLDIEMPGMDGLTFLERLMKSKPMPVVMISHLTGQNTPQAFRALELGAVDVLEKPKLAVREQLEEIAITIIDKVKAASCSKLKTHHELFLKPQKKLTADAILPNKPPPAGLVLSEKIIAVGASTGGTDALMALLQPLPLTIPGIVIVQHMPALFTFQFAERLNKNCLIHVKEAEEGDRVKTGTALLAPGDKHMLIRRDSRNNYVVRLNEGPLVSRHRPSANVLFRSVAEAAGPQSIGTLLTGMGDDGAQGLLEMREAGAITIAQDEESCVVFGMPKVAITLGAVDHVLPLRQIPEHLTRMTKTN